MTLCAIAYVSEAAPDMPQQRLDALAADAARFNRVAGVTGVLLYDGSRFLQYLEGPDDGVASVYERIVHATAHTAVQELASGRVPSRHVPYWSMRWLPVSDALVDRLVRSDWAGFIRSLGRTGARATAIDLLDELVEPLVQVG